MAHVCFTPNIQRLVYCPVIEAAHGSVREGSEGVFAGNPQARGYLLMTGPRYAST